MFFSNLQPSETPITILCEGYFSSRHAKTAIGVIRYGNWKIHSVIDSKHAGNKILDVISSSARWSVKHSNCDAPIFASIEEVLSSNNRPKALLIGIAPVGGGLPEAWISIIKTALKNGLHIISGLHEFLNDNQELQQLAKAHNVNIWDVRDPYLYSASAKHSVAKQKPRPGNVKVITMVGSDCNIGKMTVALELHQAAQTKGIRSSFVATGQTGIMISGKGVPLDRVIGDFMAGSMENLIEEIINDENPDLVFVEGQGSLLHPGYSGVTLSLLHGSNPDAMVLCHKPDLEKIQGGYEVVIPSLNKLIEIYESACEWIKVGNKSPVKVIGIALNTSAFDEKQAKDLIKQAEQETGLPCTDTVRFGGDSLLRTVIP